MNNIEVFTFIFRKLLLLIIKEQTKDFLKKKKNEIIYIYTYYLQQNTIKVL